jgi:hypothetical protein
VLSPRKITRLSPSDQDASVLGKRAHEGSPQKPETDVTPGSVEEDDDEDSVGPMSMPADPSPVGGARKKREGLSVAVNRREVAHQYFSPTARETVPGAYPCRGLLFQEFHAQGRDKFQHHHKVGIRKTADLLFLLKKARKAVFSGNKQLKHRS